MVVFSGPIHGGMPCTRACRVRVRGQRMLGEAAAQIDALQRIQRQEQRRIWRKQRRDLEALDAKLRALDEMCEAVKPCSLST